ncbi:MAG TPA: hypothetical protein VLY83_00005, partial [Methanoregula sp.]|nr:hypothetical protein [Methanoregula sp.]
GSGVPIGDVVVEDRVMETILGRVTSPDRPYDLARVSLEQIAGAFGAYLRRTVRRSAAHQAVIVDSRDTLMSGSAPARGTALADYLAGRTLRQAAANRSRQEILPLRLVDPVCGPGRLLLSAFRHLTGHDAGGPYTSEEGTQIIQDTIHGVDSSMHAVAVARLLLAAGVCGCGGTGSIQGRHGNTHAVIRDVSPLLRSAIRCGNPLVGPEITRDESWTFCPVRERHRLDPFAWDAAFPEIFAAGGFDAVIGSLPAGAVPKKEWIQQYFQRHYRVFDPAADLSSYFVEKGLSLLRPGGTLGFCMGDRWMRARSGGPLRSVLAAKQIEEIVDFPAAGGGGADRGACILRLTNRSPSHPFPVTLADPGFSGSPAEYISAHRFPVEPSGLDAGGWAFRDTRIGDLLAKIAGPGTRLEEVVMGQFRSGAGAGTARLFLIGKDEREGLIRNDPRARAFIRPVISAKDIGRYRTAADRFAIVIPRGWTDAHNKTPANPWRWFRHRHPAIARVLKKTAGDPGALPDGRHWWESAAGPGRKEPRPAVLFPALFRSPAFAPDDGRAIADETVGAIGSSSLYLLGLLNSRLTAFVLENSPRNSSGGNFHSWDDLRDFPIYTPDLDEPDDRARHDRIAALATRMIDRQKKISQAPEGSGRERLEKEIASIDRRIDAVVYALYRLTRDEIAVVESTAPS